jgi:hypothetical protein
MTQSPYENLAINEWTDKTKELIELHPLKPHVIREIALSCWNALWKTKIGDGATTIDFQDIDPPATVVGYFFEKLFSYQLKQTFPQEWRGSTNKDDKDIVYINKPDFSVEIKTSGQLAAKVFGNRSYGKKVQNDSSIKKEKSGYYITINFYKQRLNLIRFGWIDHSDWKSQEAESGQMSGLGDDVYKHKLFTIYGDYILKAPIELLQGVGDTKAKELRCKEICYLRDLQNAKINDKSLQDIKNINIQELQEKIIDFFSLDSESHNEDQLDFFEKSDLLKQTFWIVK